MEWKPIETAPRDGTTYLARNNEMYCWTENNPEGYFAGEWTRFRTSPTWRGHTHHDKRKVATYWMPIPPPESNHE